MRDGKERGAVVLVGYNVVNFQEHGIYLQTR